MTDLVRLAVGNLIKSDGATKQPSTEVEANVVPRGDVKNVRQGNTVPA
jgi:hypothetical protein